MDNARLLLIEDNARPRPADRDILELAGYEVAVAPNLDEARARLARRTPDALVLSIALPDGGELDFLTELRRSYTLPVLILSDLDSARDTVAGLERGADDYLARPYDEAVLLARVKALIRRAGQVPECIRKGPISFHIVAGRAFLQGKDLMLTAKEFSVLLLLEQNEGQVLRPDKLYEVVWRQPLLGDNQALRTVIARLRSKLAGSGCTIESRRGEGYRFQFEGEGKVV